MEPNASYIPSTLKTSSTGVRLGEAGDDPADPDIYEWLLYSDASTQNQTSRDRANSTDIEMSSPICGGHVEHQEYVASSSHQISETAVGPISSTEEINFSAGNLCIGTSPFVHGPSLIVSDSNDPSDLCLNTYSPAYSNDYSAGPLLPKSEAQKSGLYCQDGEVHKPLYVSLAQSWASVGPVSSFTEPISLRDTDSCSLTNRVVADPAHQSVDSWTEEQDPDSPLAHFSSELYSDSEQCDSRRARDEADVAIAHAATPLIPLVLDGLESDTSESKAPSVASPGLGPSVLVEMLSPEGDEQDPFRLGSPHEASVPLGNFELEDMSPQQALRVDIFQRRPDLLGTWSSEQSTLNRNTGGTEESLHTDKELGDRRTLQKRRNMIAARKSRDKKKKEHERLRKEVNAELSEQTRLTYEIKKLQREKNELQRMVCEHNLNCHTHLPFSPNLPPAPNPRSWTPGPMDPEVLLQAGAQEAGLL